MKFSKLSKKGQQGGTLIVALFTCLAIGIILSSALLVTSSRNKITVRSMAWNATMPVLEAGVEEAFTHLHDDVGHPATNGWISTNISGQTIYAKTRTFTDGSYFYATIYNATSNNPIIYSSGFVPSPLGGSGYISRTVKVLATNPPTIFTKAIASSGPIDVSGIVDSYDSSLGPYNTTNNRSIHGSIATDSRANPAITVRAGTKVYGTVSTGSGGLVNMMGGSVGDVAWNSNPANTGIETPTTSWSDNTMNVAFPSNSPPSGGPWLAPTILTPPGSNITVLATGTNQLAAFTSNNSTMPMMVTGNATLYVTGNFTVSGSGYVYIAPGASLTLYVGGPTTSIQGGGFVNATGQAANFTYIGLSGNTTLKVTGGSDFVGTINAPQAAITVSGGSSVYGAVIANTFLSSGGLSNVHYDQSLGATGGLIANGWVEL